LVEAVCGLAIGVVAGLLIAVLMDMSDLLYRANYPILVITQTIPTIAIAPLMVLWFGYEMTPKVILVALATFFPIAVGLLDGFKSVDEDSLNLLRSMGAGKIKLFRYVKFPSALPNFFSGLKIAASYSIVTAVVSEWLGGFQGLGIYMTKVKKAYAYDKLFAVIIVISIVSLLLILVVRIIERKSMPYMHLDEEK
jgi:ABC-type nitrate/sulfonate/bicarbonate transport system permease component